MRGFIQTAALVGVGAVIAWAANALFGERTMLILIGCFVIIGLGYQVEHLKQRVEALESDIRAISRDL